VNELTDFIKGYLERMDLLNQVMPSGVGREMESLPGLKRQLETLA
jgi:hypothetical protein